MANFIATCTYLQILTFRNFTTNLFYCLHMPNLLLNHYQKIMNENENENRMSYPACDKLLTWKLFDILTTWLIQIDSLKSFFFYFRNFKSSLKKKEFLYRLDPWRICHQFLCIVRILKCEDENIQKLFQGFPPSLLI